MNLPAWADDLLVSGKSKQELVTMYIELRATGAKFGFGFRRGKLEFWSNQPGPEGQW